MPDAGSVTAGDDGASSTSYVLRRILVLGWRYRSRFLASLGLAAVSAAAAGFLLIAVERLVRAWSTVQASLDQGVTSGSADLAAAYALMHHTAWQAVALAPLVALTTYLAFLTGQQLANACIRDLRLAFVGHLVELDLHFHTAMAKGDLFTRMMTDLDGVRSMVQRLYSRVLQRPLEITVLLVYVVVMDWRLGLVLCAGMLPVVLVLAPIVGRTKRRARKARVALADNLIAFEQIISGVRVIKAMGSAERERERFRGTNRTVYDKRMRVARSKGQSEAITQASLFLILALTLWAGAWLFSRGLTTPAVLLAVLYAFGRLTAALRELQHAVGDLIEHQPAAERIFAILDREPALRDDPALPECPPPRQGIDLDEVRFRYGPDQDEVLRGIALRMAVGSTVALVGPSGGGKTTLLDLIPRLHDATGGAVRWDGVDVRGYRPSSVVRHCAIVQQDPFLFDGTVAENIRYGRPDASDAEVELAARRAHVHDDILRLEGGQGYATPVGDRGGRLSGGQRQRVSIARALLRDAPLLLLDEPTSALDAASEAHVQAALLELMRGRTTVIVAHRLATVRHADRIVVLGGKDDGDLRGRIIESGTHAELIAAGGAYAALVAKQDLG